MHTFKESLKLFDDTANFLLNQSVLKINNFNYRIVEIEFYEKSSAHPDPFVHSNKDQLTFGKWYFHKFGSTYKDGTYKGLDLTFGSIKSTKNHKYGGILIRSIKNLETNNVIEGPCRTVNHILKKCSVNSIAELVGETIMDAFDDTSKLYIKELQNELPKETIYQGPRVGLTLKNKSNLKLRKKYINKNYRYVIFIDKIKKWRNTVIQNMYQQGLSKERIQEITGVRKHFIEKYLKDIEIENKNKNKNKNKNRATTVVNVKKVHLQKIGYINFEDWVKDPNNVYIGRHNVYVKGTFKSKWCNPYSAKKYGREKCIDMYKQYLIGNDDLFSHINELKGKTLGCWCKPEACHGDIILQMLTQHNTT